VETRKISRTLWYKTIQTTHNYFQDAKTSSSIKIKEVNEEQFDFFFLYSTLGD